MRRLIFFVIAILLALQFRICLVTGSSMYPTYHNEDLVLTTKYYGNVDVGDVIVFEGVQKDGKTVNVIHRVISITHDGKIFTQGDNNPNPDPGYIYENQIMYIVP